MSTPRRLMARSPGFGDPARELDESDVIAQAQAREQAVIDAMPDLSAEDGPKRMWHYSPKELGLIVLAARDHRPLEEVAEVLGRTVPSVRQELAAIRLWVGAKSRKDAAKRRG